MANSYVSVGMYRRWLEQLIKSQQPKSVNVSLLRTQLSNLHPLTLDR